MKSIEFKGQNVVFGKGQEEYADLPSFAQENGIVTNCFELTSEEIQEVVKNEIINITVLNFGRPPQPMAVRFFKPQLPISHKINVKANPVMWQSLEQGECAVFRFSLSEADKLKLKKDRVIWITTVTHGAAFQPISQTLI